MRIQTLDTTEVGNRIRSLKALADYRPDSVLSQFDRLFRECRASRYDEGIRQVLQEMTILSSKIGKYDSGLIYAMKALELSDSVSQREDVAILYNTIGNIYRGQAKLLEAYQAQLKAQRFASESPIVLGKIWNNMSIVLSTLGHTDKALQLLEKASDVARKHNDGYLWVITLLNLSNRYATSESAEKKRQLTDSAIHLAKAFKEYSLLYEAILHKAGDLLNEDRASEGLSVLGTADTVTHIVAPTPRQRQMYFRVKGAIYQRLGNYKLAEKCLLEAAKGMNELDKMQLYIHLSGLYEEMGDYKKAYYMFRHNKEAEARFGALIIHDRINELETQYRTAEKDKTIADQKLLVAQKAHQVKFRNLWLGIIGGGTVLLGGFTIVLYRSMRHKQRLQLAQQENLRLKSLMEGEEQERMRVSGELHDGIGGILSAAKMSFSGMQLSQADDALKYHEGIQLLDEAYKELRRTAHNLSPELLKQQGLPAATASFCDKIALAHHLDIRFQHFGDFSNLSEHLAVAAYRTIQELVHNVVKHARARQVLVQLRKEASFIHIVVEDDGVGMPDEDFREGLGLHHLRMRVKALKGTVEIDSRRGQGTTVYISDLNAEA